MFVREFLVSNGNILGLGIDTVNSLSPNINLALGMELHGAHTTPVLNVTPNLVCNSGRLRHSILFASVMSALLSLVLEKTSGNSTDRNNATISPINGSICLIAEHRNRFVVSILAYMYQHQFHLISKKRSLPRASSQSHAKHRLHHQQ